MPAITPKLPNYISVKHPHKGREKKTLKLFFKVVATIAAGKSQSNSVKSVLWLLSIELSQTWIMLKACREKGIRTDHSNNRESSKNVLLLQSPSNVAKKKSSLSWTYW